METPGEPLVRKWLCHTKLDLNLQLQAQNLTVPRNSTGVRVSPNMRLHRKTMSDTISDTGSVPVERVYRTQKLVFSLFTLSSQTYQDTFGQW